MREKLIELLTDCDCPYPCKAADHLIENGVTLQKWIPVEERMPDDFVSVLVVIPSEHPMPMVKEAYHADSRWFGKCGIFADGDVPYWMPMPEPPKEG